MRLVDTSESWNSLTVANSNEIVVAIGRDKLVGMANALGEALLSVEEWEFDTRVGILPEDARTLRDQIGEILRSTYSPE